MSAALQPVDSLSGRIQSGPAELLHEEVLGPQFEYECRHLLSRYLLIEKVFATEYQRLGLITATEAEAIWSALGSVDPQTLVADPRDNMSDIAFAIERDVEHRLSLPLPARWHVDRSRNDFQACAQLMFGKDETLATAEELITFGTVVLEVARRTVELPMPGFTHLQPAQVITPGFYLAAIAEHSVRSLSRLLRTYDGIDLCPLGAGAMAGQELDWDRDGMARSLGFRGYRPHALSCVAARDWALELACEFSLLGSALSRFVTDLMNWASDRYGFIELPDELSGISSAMPQKKNYPILERIRGKAGHLGASYLHMLLGQRNTPYANSVEVSKEAGAELLPMFQTARRLLRLFTEVLRQLVFRADRMRASCESEYLGGFSLANYLTLQEDVPWRKAQVIAGSYIVAAQQRRLSPADGDPELLRDAAAALGFPLRRPAEALAEAFDVDAGLRRKRSPGSTHPAATTELLDHYEAELAELAACWAQRSAAVRSALGELGPITAGGRPGRRMDQESRRA